MDFSIKHSKLRALADFVVLAVILGFVTHCAYLKIDSMLKSSLEDAVALNSRSIAVGLNNQFGEKFMKLGALVYNLESGRISFDNLSEIFLHGTIGEKIGVVSKNNEGIFGDALPPVIFDRFQKVFDGENFVTYHKTFGLIFAVPVNIYGERCLLYNAVSNASVKKAFHAESYNGSGTVILLNSFEDWMVINDGDELINTDPGMDDNWAALAKKIDSNPDENSWSTFGTFEGRRYFLYLADISEKYDFAISGYVSWEKAAVGIDYIYSVMLGTFFLIFLFLIFGVRYMFKSRQAKFFKQEKILADSANQAKSAFLSNMSHEIRTPINAIMGMNEMVIRETNDPAILEYSENLQNAAKTLLGLVNDILDFSKIEAGKMEIIPVEYHLSSVLNDLVNMIETRAEKKGLKFIVEADKNLPSVLFGDEIRIKQVITNILTNAVKYTEKGSVTLKVEFYPVDREKISLKVSVIDTGIGIKPEDMQKLFSAFERIEEKRNRSIEGTGLGMNITQQLLTMMDSKLEVSSVYGEGSNFSFELLQKVVSNEPIGDFQENYHKALSQRKKYQKTFTAPDAEILVVDDTPMNLTVIKSLLKQTKIKIETAADGYECLKLVQEKNYDVIFLDHKMPGLDGIETLQEMKKLPNNLNKNTPIISLTANAISGAREKYISAGFQDYLTKPIDSMKLENLLTKYLPKEKIQAADEKNSLTEEKNLPDWLKKIDELNIDSGIKNCGDVDSYLDALKIFANSILSGADEIQKYFDAEDWKNYTTKVHALKSSSRIIGAIDLSKLAEKLENDGNSNNIEEIKNHTPTLLENYRNFAEKFQPLIETVDENSDKPLISDDELNEAYQTLKEISASFDYDSLQFVLKSLEDYRLPESEVERYKKIKIAADKLDWETITSLLNDRN